MKKLVVSLVIALSVFTIIGCKKDANTTVIKAKVVKFKDQQPLSHASVTIETPNGTEVAKKFTNASGEVEFTGIAAGDYIARGYWEGGNPNTDTDDYIDFDGLGHPSFRLDEGETESVFIQLK